jgi:hypothetical protein
VDIYSICVYLGQALHPAVNNWVWTCPPRPPPDIHILLLSRVAAKEDPVAPHYASAKPLAPAAMVPSHLKIAPSGDGARQLDGGSLPGALSPLGQGLASRTRASASSIKHPARAKELKRVRHGRDARADPSPAPLCPIFGRDRREIRAAAGAQNQGGSRSSGKLGWSSKSCGGHLETRGGCGRSLGRRRLNISKSSRCGEEMWGKTRW